MREIDIAKRAVRNSYVELREAIDQLRDISGYNDTLAEWMRKYTKDSQISHGIIVHTNIEKFDEIQLPDEQRVQITRVIQEIFNNIRKYSLTKNIKLNCTCMDNIHVVSILDNGIGFDTSTDYKGKYCGNGLIILQDRIHSIQGNLEIKSAKNEGTKIEIEIPIAT